MDCVNPFEPEIEANLLYGMVDLVVPVVDADYLYHIDDTILCVPYLGWSKN